MLIFVDLDQGMTTTRSQRFHRPITLVGALAALAVLTIGCGANRSTVQGVGSTTPPASNLPTGSHAQTITVDGTLRSYRTYVPAGIDRNTPTPLVVMIHGGFGSAEHAEKAYGWDAMADAHHFIVAYPDGLGKAWNAGSCCGASAQRNVDDVGFITQMVAGIQKQESIDPRRIFVTGMSNGAMMTERLACETDVFAAAASVAGAQMVSCDDPHPISMLHIHGLADHNVPFDGSPGDGRGKVPAHPPIPDTIAAWRTIDHCATPIETKAGVVTRSTSGCADGRAVDLITIADAGHQWPGATKLRPQLAKLVGMDTPSTAIDATAEIWKFFAAHPRPERTPTSS